MIYGRNKVLMQSTTKEKSPIVAGFRWNFEQSGERGHSFFFLTLDFFHEPLSTCFVDRKYLLLTILHNTWSFHTYLRKMRKRLFQVFTKNSFLNKSSSSGAGAVPRWIRFRLTPRNEKKKKQLLWNKVAINMRLKT